jgi:hypothetical protein
MQEDILRPAHTQEVTVMHSWVHCHGGSRQYTPSMHMCIAGCSYPEHVGDTGVCHCHAGLLQALTGPAPTSLRALGPGPGR